MNGSREELADMTSRTPIARVLNIFIKILLIPVQIKRNGEFHLKLCSFRFFISFLVWSVIPSIMLGHSINPFLISLSTIGTSTTIAVSLSFLLLFISYLTTSPSMGYLVARCNTISTISMTLPRRKFGISLCILLWLVGNILNLTMKTQPEFVLIHSMLTAVYFINYSLVIILVNIYTSTFINRCNKFKEISDNTILIKESIFLVTAYENLEQGLGFSYVLNYLIHITFIIFEAYWLVAVDFNPAFCLLALSYFLLIWNLASTSQDCFSTLKNTGAVLR